MSSTAEVSPLEIERLCTDPISNPRNADFVGVITRANVCFNNKIYPKPDDEQVYPYTRYIVPNRIRSFRFRMIAATATTATMTIDGPDWPADGPLSWTMPFFTMTPVLVAASAGTAGYPQPQARLRLSSSSSSSSSSS
jgi:hypothetical protein